MRQTYQGASEQRMFLSKIAIPYCVGIPFHFLGKLFDVVLTQIDIYYQRCINDGVMTWISARVLRQQ